MHPTPAVAAQAAPSAGSRMRGHAGDKHAAAAGGAPVLVVHASPALRGAIGKALQAAGFTPVMVECADAALALAPQSWAAALLQTPVTTGEKPTQMLLRILRAQDGAHALPVVQLAPAESSGTPLAQADACLCETAAPEALATTVHGLVRAHRAEEMLRLQQAGWRASQAQAQLQAHALRNPLNAILMSAQVLAKMPLPPDALRAVDAICRNAQAQAHLISDTLQAQCATRRDAAPSDSSPR